jgi:uncharacterized protein (TIGR03066 family)
MKALNLLAVVCVLAVGVRAEDKKPDYAKMIVGKWEVTKADEGTLPVGSIIEFTKDGKFTSREKLESKEITFEGSYKVEGDKFNLDLKVGDQTIKVSITITKMTDDEMHTKNDEGKVVEVKRKK